MIYLYRLMNNRKIHFRPPRSAIHAAMKECVLPAVLLSGLVFAGCAAHTASYASDPSRMLLDQSKLALCIPLDSLHVKYLDNTASISDSVFSDSFFVQAANGLLSFEVSRNFKVCAWPRNESDSFRLLRQSGYSRLDKDTTNVQLASNVVRQIAERYKADLVVVPYSLQIRQIIVKPSGWRDDRFGSAYERPTSYTAKTSFHVQIWDKNGRLLYERIGRSTTGNFFLYSMLKKAKNPDKDIVKYAKRFYAHPLVKALYDSIKLAMMVKM